MEATPAIRVLQDQDLSMLGMDVTGELGPREASRFGAAGKGTSNQV